MTCPSVSSHKSSDLEKFGESYEPSSRLFGFTQRPQGGRSTVSLTVLPANAPSPGDSRARAPTSRQRAAADLPDSLGGRSTPATALGERYPETLSSSKMSVSLAKISTEKSDPSKRKCLVSPHKKPFPLSCSAAIQLDEPTR